MKKKNIFFWTCVGLVIAFLIFAVIFTPIQACNKSSDGPDTPVEPDPGPGPGPGHEHQWEWKYTSTEHWQVATCHDDITRNRGTHKFAVDNDNSQREKCSTCGYSRPLPTKQDDLNVSFGDDGASIGGFADEHLPDLVIPGTVTDPDTGEEIPIVEVKDEAFKLDQTLTTLTILDGLKSIGKDAFTGCSKLEEIRIPKSVEYIDNQAFLGCKSLKRIYVDPDNPVYRDIDNCLIRRADKVLILGCSESSIPCTTYKESGEYIVTSIGDYAFYGSGIQEIVIPNNITSIGKEAFRECKSLVSAFLPEGLNKINVLTFYECTALSTVNMPEGITEIDQNAFTGCTSLDNISLPASLKVIGDNAFSGCTSLKEITLNEGLTGIGKSAFRGCTKLESITLPSSILGIGSEAFVGCTKLTEIVYAGTEEDWNEKNIDKREWKPEGVEVTFSEPETGDSENADDEDDADDTDGSDDTGADNQN